MRRRILVEQNGVEEEPAAGDGRIFAGQGDAEELAPQVGNDLVARLIWTKAEIADSRADHAQAERSYGEALEIYRLVSPIDAALAAVQLSRAQIRLGKLGEARETTVAMSSLLGPLQKNRVISAALMRLIRIVLEGGRIADGMYEREAREIRRERARLERRPLDRA